MNHAERVAKLVLERILPGTLEYQQEQSHGECDFQLRYHSGATAAVEVTASVDEQQIQTIAATRSKKKGGSTADVVIYKIGVFEEISSPHHDDILRSCCYPCITLTVPVGKYARFCLWWYVRQFMG
ncbi:MAG: hypothetical protein WCD47_02760 [Candidatus Sulfotelmatobacter sp.]